MRPASRPRAAAHALRLALVICGKDLRQRLRDRSALVGSILLPLLLAGIIGGSLGGTGGSGYRLRLALASRDAATAEALRAFLASDWRGEVVELQAVRDRTEAAAALAADRADAAILAGSGATLEVLADGRDAYAARAAEALARSFLARGGADRDTAPGLSPLRPRSAGGRLRTLDFFACSMAVLFLNFAVLAGARALRTEQESGGLQRLAASPAPAWAILTGKFSAIVAGGLLQIGVLIAATHLLFGTDWGRPLPVALLALGSVLSAAGLMLVVVSLAGDAERGNAIGNVTIFLLAVVGGQFLPPQGLPDVFDTLARLTPNGQAFHGFVDLAAAGGSGGLASVAEPICVTLGIGIAGIAFGVRRAARTLERVA